MYSKRHLGVMKEKPDQTFAPPQGTFYAQDLTEAHNNERNNTKTGHYYQLKGTVFLFTFMTGFLKREFKWFHSPKSIKYQPSEWGLLMKITRQHQKSKSIQLKKLWKDLFIMDTVMTVSLGSDGLCAVATSNRFYLLVAGLRLFFLFFLQSVGIFMHRSW